VEVWRLASLCLMWCLWKEWTARNFEDVETSVIELRRIMFNTLYTWLLAHHSLLFSSFADFLNFCSYFFPGSGFPLYTYYVLGLRLLMRLNKKKRSF
jgi:hypothetical protein